MQTSTTHCSQAECEKKREHLERLSIEALYNQLEQCEQCEIGPFKESSFAADTYQVIALYWAQRHNMSVGSSLH